GLLAADHQADVADLATVGDGLELLGAGDPLAVELLAQDLERMTAGAVQAGAVVPAHRLAVTEAGKSRLLGAGVGAHRQPIVGSRERSTNRPGGVAAGAGGVAERSRGPVEALERAGLGQ